MLLRHEDKTLWLKLTVCVCVYVFVRIDPRLYHFSRRSGASSRFRFFKLHPFWVTAGNTGHVPPFHRLMPDTQGTRTLSFFLSYMFFKTQTHVGNLCVLMEVESFSAVPPQKQRTVLARWEFLFISFLMLLPHDVKLPVPKVLPIWRHLLWDAWNQ